MQKVAIGIGTLLFLMGIGFYLAADPTRRSFTALIPSVLGLVIGICGMLAQNEVRRKMAMHIAAGVALLGILGSLPRILPVLTGAPIKLPLAFAAQLLTVLLCSVFLVLCVRSFIDARRTTKM